MIYLDNSATTLPDSRVLETFSEASLSYFANPASLHKAGSKANHLLQSSRQQIAKLAGDVKSEVIFTSGGTEANNLAIIGYARKMRHRGTHIITTEIEHDSIRKACEFLETEGFTVDWLTVNEQGIISLEELKEKIRKDTILVSIMHVNNEIGAIQPIEECSRIIRKYSRAVFHSDCVQSVGKIELPYPQWTDAITLSSHKFHGLKGSGCLITHQYKTPEAISFGGGQEEGMRSGTVNTAGAAALAKAFRLAVTEQDVHMMSHMRNYMYDQLKDENRIRILSTTQGAPHIFTVAIKNITGEVAVNYFQESGIIISTSSACSSKKKQISHVVKALRIPNDYEKGIIRFSFSRQNSIEEVKQAVEVFKQFLFLTEKGLKRHDME